MDSNQRYLKDLTDKLAATRKRVAQGRAVKALKDNAPELFEIIDLEISLAVNRQNGETPLSDRDYLASFGEVKALRRIRDVMESRAAEEVSAAEEAKAIDAQRNAISK